MSIKLTLKPSIGNETNGISVTEFTSKYNNHTMSFRNRIHENDLELLKFFWSLKDQNKEFEIQLPIFKKSSRSESWNLCLLKNLVISNFKEKERLVSKWLDLVSKCRHENKYMLINYWLTQIHYNLLVIFICNVFCVYKKFFEKINITSEGLSMKHKKQCNVKSELFNCLMNIALL